MPALHFYLRLTARIACMLFVVAFVERAPGQLWASRLARWIADNTNRLFLGFVAAHTVHLALIGVLAYRVGPSFFTLRLLPGGLVYLTIYLLAWSALAQQLQLPSRPLPRRLRSVLLYIVWVVFLVALGSGVPTYPFIYAPFALALLAALSIRIIGLHAAAHQTRRQAAKVMARAASQSG